VNEREHFALLDRIMPAFPVNPNDVRILCLTLAIYEAEIVEEELQAGCAPRARDVVSNLRLGRMQQLRGWVRFCGVPELFKARHAPSSFFLGGGDDLQCAAVCCGGFATSAG